jgi:metal-sulfur cluster biosynthetic enzyme
MTDRTDLPALAWHDQQVRRALHRVYDPCSLASNNPLSLIDMGLVREWELDDERNLQVRMCVTSPSCMMAPTFLEAAREELRKIEGIGTVTVEVDVSVFWTEDLMSERGKRLAQIRRGRGIGTARARPQQWRELPVLQRDAGP